MNKFHTRSGFTLVELLVVFSILVILAVMAIPRLTGAKLGANETAAVAVLRALNTAQTQTLANSSIDTDGDGSAEYAYFAELSGSVPARISIGGAPGPGVPGTDELEPSPLLRSLGNVQNRIVTRSGYIFQIWLPASTVGGRISGIPEDINGGKVAGPFPNPDNGEAIYCAYGWPMEYGKSGNAAFFINQFGTILQTNNRGAGGPQYAGIGGGPNFDAALTVADDMASDMALNGAASVDGNSWVIVQ